MTRYRQDGCKKGTYPKGGRCVPARNNTIGFRYSHKRALAAGGILGLGVAGLVAGEYLGRRDPVKHVEQQTKEQQSQPSPQHFGNDEEISPIVPTEKEQQSQPSPQHFGNDEEFSPDVLRKREQRRTQARLEWEQRRAERARDLLANQAEEIQRKKQEAKIQRAEIQEIFNSPKYKNKQSLHRRRAKIDELIETHGEQLGLDKKATTDIFQRYKSARKLFGADWTPEERERNRKKSKKIGKRLASNVEKLKQSGLLSKKDSIIATSIAILQSLPKRLP